MGLANGEGGGGWEGRDASEVRGEEACLLGGGSGRNAWRMVGEGGSCRAGLLLARFDVRCWDAGW